VAAHPSDADLHRGLVNCVIKLASLSQNGGDVQGEKIYRRRCHQALVRMQRAGMDLDERMAQLLEQLEAVSASESFASTRCETAPECAFSNRPTTHPQADANKATELNKRFQKELAEWNALPWWKRIKTKRPEPPKGM
jgi:hypothetical protein